MITKKEANYRPAKSLDKQCGNCSMYRADRNSLEGAGRCTLVKGEIDSEYVCDHWAKQR